MNRPIRHALTTAAAIASLVFTGLTASACAAQPTVLKAHVITIPAPDQVSDVYHADQCPWLKLFMASTVAATETASAADGRSVKGPDAAFYSMLISSPLCAEHSMVGN